jgi:hypothetical protein
MNEHSLLHVFGCEYVIQFHSVVQDLACGDRRCIWKHLWLILYRCAVYHYCLSLWITTRCLLGCRILYGTLAIVAIV